MSKRPLVILYHEDKVTITWKEGGRFLWTVIIREDFLEEVRFQVRLKDNKDKDHWKWVRGEDVEWVKNVHPRKTSAVQAYSGSTRVNTASENVECLENSLQFLKRLKIELTYDPVISLLGMYPR